MVGIRVDTFGKMWVLGQNKPSNVAKHDSPIRHIRYCPEVPPRIITNRSIGRLVLRCVGFVGVDMSRCILRFSYNETAWSVYMDDVDGEKGGSTFWQLAAGIRRSSIGTYGKLSLPQNNKLLYYHKTISSSITATKAGANDEASGEVLRYGLLGEPP
eukprot:971325-Amorphochlora_amoeboformis.AAC.1